MAGDETDKPRNPNSGDIKPLVVSENNTDLDNMFPKILTVIEDRLRNPESIPVDDLGKLSQQYLSARQQYEAELNGRFQRGISAQNHRNQLILDENKETREKESHNDKLVSIKQDRRIKDEEHISTERKKTEELNHIIKKNELELEGSRLDNDAKRLTNQKQTEETKNLKLDRWIKGLTFGGIIISKLAMIGTGIFLVVHGTTGPGLGLIGLAFGIDIMSLFKKK